MKKKSLTELTKEWDEKLAKSGFVDIERNGRLNRWHHADFQYFYTPERFLQKQNFYLRASQLFEDHPFLEYFLTSRELEVWSLYCQGHGCKRQIPEILAMRGRPLNKDYVNRIVRDIKSMLMTLLEAPHDC